MAGLSSGSQLIKDCVIDALLCVEKVVEVVRIGHQLSAAKYILPGTISCLALLDYKTGHSLPSSTAHPHYFSQRYESQGAEDVS